MQVLNGQTRNVQYMVRRGITLSFRKKCIKVFKCTYGILGGFLVPSKGFLDTPKRRWPRVKKIFFFFV